MHSGGAGKGEPSGEDQSSGAGQEPAAEAGGRAQPPENSAGGGKQAEAAPGVREAADPE